MNFNWPSPKPVDYFRHVGPNLKTVELIEKLNSDNYDALITGTEMSPQHIKLQPFHLLLYVMSKILKKPIRDIAGFVLGTSIEQDESKIYELIEKDPKAFSFYVELFVLVNDTMEANAWQKQYLQKVINLRIVYGSCILLNFQMQLPSKCIIFYEIFECCLGPCSYMSTLIHIHKGFPLSDQGKNSGFDIQLCHSSAAYVLTFYFLTIQ